MKKCLILILIALSSSVMADELHNYADVKSAIQSGKKLSMLIDFSNCTLGNGNKSPVNMSAVITPSEIIINNDKDYMTSSLFHFTLSHPAFPGKGVYEFSKYTLTKDDNFTYSVQAVDPSNYQPIKEGVTFNCRLGISAKIYTA